MDQLITFLKNIPEYTALVQAVRNHQTAAVTGVGQINRSHLIAGLRQDLSAPLVLICQDDMAARRLQEELKAFLGQEIPILPSRELTLYDSAVVSRAWEQKRLRQLHCLKLGQTPDAVLIDVEAAMEAMGEVTGNTVREDITARIFERFCVGK